MFEIHMKIFNGVYPAFFVKLVLEIAVAQQTWTRD